MNLIIATSDAKFGKLLQENISKLDVNVVDIVTCVEDLLECLAQNPSVDGILLKTDLAKKNGDYRLEILSDVVLSIRKTPEFENLTFTVLSDYKEGHPLLAELFEMGIYNFFTRNATGFTVSNLVDSFQKPMSFSMSLKYRSADPTIPWRRNISEKQVLHVNFESEKKKKDSKVENSPNEIEERKSTNNSAKETSTLDFMEEEQGHEQERKIKNLFSKNNLKLNIPVPKLSKTSDGAKEVEEEFDDEWFFEEKKEVSITPPSIGTVIIGVTAVAEHLGSTNTAISIAKYLEENGYDVALVEANRNMDFDRIHSLIEGEKITLKDIEFRYSGVDHIKYRENLDLGTVYTHYQYIVLDLGDFKNTPFKEELSRSHIKCVVATADEWKYHWIEEFLLDYDSYDLNFLVPASDNKMANDLAARLKNYDVYPLDKHTNPYDVPELTANVYDRLLKNFKQDKGTNQINSKILIMTGLLGAILSAIGFSIFTFF